jgi:hypothetical protein
MSDDLMRYDQLAQTALRNGVVREALRRAEREGLPGDHHFYLTFNTAFPGVSISDRMREKYPREMTIVLQHQFEDLRVRDDGFDVRLSFDNIPERLSIPFESLKAFFDPAVPFGLQFEVVQAQQNVGNEQARQAGAALGETKAAKPAKQARKPAKTDDSAVSAEAFGEAGELQEEHKVVSLDSFRKK